MPKAPTIQGEPAISQKGSNVLLECIVEANPEPNCKWFREEKDLEEGVSYKFSKDGFGVDKWTIVCKILNFDKPLAGIYKLNITNEAGNTTATFTVAAGYAPEFIEKPKIVSKDGGKVLGIKIHVKSKTEPKVTWFKDDKSLQSNDRISPSMKKVEDKADEYVCVLEIKMPQKDDEANYKCVVVNSEGSNSQSLKLAFD